MVLEDFRIEEFLQVGFARKVAFPLGLKAGNPLPRERVGGGVPIKEVLLKKLTAKGPGEAGDVNPVACEPHPGVVVKVSSLH